MKNLFEEVYREYEALLKKYYSCFPFLLQMCVLLVNHYMLAEGKVRQEELLEDHRTLPAH